LDFGNPPHDCKLKELIKVLIRNMMGSGRVVYQQLWLIREITLSVFSLLQVRIIITMYPG
jgi:hypothetical protein